MAINNFKKLRLSRGLTVEELAVASDVHAQTINAIENGTERDTRVDTMRRLAKGLDVDYEDVYQAIFEVNTTPVEL